MNHGVAWSSDSRKVRYRQIIESPVAGDMSLYDSSEYSSFLARECVEDHDTARNSSNESNTSPFDIFLKKKTIALKPSILEQNREKRKTAFKSFGNNKDLLQTSSSSSSKNIIFSGDSFFLSECDVKDVPRMRCDLENRKKGVSLSCQESVSSTSNQKVELNSVEEHDNACKSGGAGNSSNESSMRPFDLFLKKKVMGLKPTLQDLNREKRKAAKGYTDPGMVHLKKYLSICDQVMIVNKCREMGLGEGELLSARLIGWRVTSFENDVPWETLGLRLYGETRPVDDSIPPQIPSENSVSLFGKAIKESQSLVATNSKEMKGEDRIPSMSPDICIVNFYTSTGRLGLHQDKGESEKPIRKGLPVVSFSIGYSAEFLYGDQRDADKAEMVVLESGDVLLFGGKSRNVFHGVRSILKDTAPKTLVQETSLRPGRLNLTFRQY